MRSVAGPAAGRSAHLVGREPEQAHVAAFADGLPDGARALLIRGEPGIGKTALWQAAVAGAADADCEVLVTRAAEEEMTLGLAGLVDLLERVDIDTGPLLAEDNPFARGRALLAALRGLAEHAPVVVAVDDLQWLDAASARALRFALRRLDGEPVGVLATLRRGTHDPLAAATTLPPGRCETLDLGPLDLEALRRVLGGIVEAISRPALQRIHRVSAGNPLYAIELARGLAAGPRRSPGLRLPDSLQAAIASRLETVSGELAVVLRTASAIGPAPVRELREALLALDVDALLGAAEDQGLLVVDEDLRVRFSHPVIGSVVYDRMSALTRRALHASLAARAVDGDVRARHLALSTDEPSAPVAALLEAAAERARGRDAFDLAADFAGHSVRLTPARDVEDMLRRACAEIEDLAIAGEASRALALAEALVARLPPGPARAEALIRRAGLDDGHVDTGVAVLREALGHVGADDLRRARVLDQLGWSLSMFAGDLPAGRACSREAQRLAEHAGDGSLLMYVLSVRAYLDALGGEPQRELMARAVALEERLGKPIVWTSPRTLLAETLLWDGDLPGARRLFEDVHDEAVRAATAMHHAYSMFDLALVDVAGGALGDADARVHDGVQAARDAEDRWGERLLLYPRALVDAWCGRSDRARAAARRRLDEARAKGERPGIVRARGVLGLLALSEGALAAAARELGAAADLLEEMGFVHPGAFPALPDAVEAIACNGDLDRAVALLARLERGAAATDSAWARAAADRSRGAILLARGDPGGALGPLDRAVAAFDRLGHRPDAARAVLLRGRALLRAGRRTHAADELAEAGRRFEAIGAPLWAARAAGELERAAPGRASGALTPAERRVAGLVAQGMKNREIAAALFMSVGTVEAHLTRMYRKLGIRSRSALTRRVTDGSL